MNTGNLNAYQSMVTETFHTVGQAIGIHVMLLVVEHALWKTKHKYEEASLIQFSEDGIVLQSLDELEPEQARVVAQDFILAIVATLGRLVGKQLAHQLTEQLQINSRGE